MRQGSITRNTSPNDMLPPAFGQNSVPHYVVFFFRAFSDNPDSKNDDSLGEPKKLTANDDQERMFNEYLEHNKRFENKAASLKVNATGGRFSNGDANGTE
ncbi:hypothetical protein LWI28_028642 [Acer negundo]|uniref:Uncharacterized protein n=1 Tax=Acer negundo TaxID=4023 RepID=A0AAD5J1W1_ACENE|nr:hypothetical protein LWI28_028642 [Acer negundo]